MDPRFEQFKDLDWKSMSFPEKRDVWLQISDMSAEDFDAMMANQKRGKARCLRLVIMRQTLNWSVLTEPKSAPVIT